MLMLLAVLAIEEPIARTASVPYRVIQVNGPEFSNAFDWQNKGPIEFIDHLKSSFRKGAVNVFYVGGYHIGWITPNDIPKLRALTSSTEACVALCDPASSQWIPQGSTVGAIADQMIQAYQEGGFPTWNKDRVKK